MEGHARAAPLDDAARRLVDLWNSDLALHFDEEDEDLLPYLGAAPELADRLRADHAALRGAFAALDGDSGADAFHAVAVALRTHIRWEEDVLFEWLQRNLDAAALDGLWQRSRRYRLEHRGLDSVREPSLPR